MSNSTNPPEFIADEALADTRPTETLGDELANTELPLAHRFRVLFTLRHRAGPESVTAISRAFADESVLLKHEVAYVLGQMQERSAVPILISVLENTRQDCMVRHEAGEALGAIGDMRALPVLERFSSDPDSVVAETCQVAVRLLQWSEKDKATEGVGIENETFVSVDPAPPSAVRQTIPELQATLRDGSLPLFERYRALFALRNDASDEAALAICSAFGDPSALFRHELAYVLGQLQNPVTVDALRAVLQTAGEHEMVRHEAAEALGSIATDEVLPLLESYQHDAHRVVSESCQVALDMAAYEASGAFEMV
eukprot:c55985_g1_i1.p1 GENE.c55985_g1_i1~~c55985_g1_i1.p1  ORF type:complete len:312 (+),score=66.02 c55985_g1_i1:127-1062(+)